MKLINNMNENDIYRNNEDELTVLVKQRLAGFIEMSQIKGLATPEEFYDIVKMTIAPDNLSCMDINDVRYFCRLPQGGNKDKIFDAMRINSSLGNYKRNFESGIQCLKEVHQDKKLCGLIITVSFQQKLVTSDEFTLILQDVSDGYQDALDKAVRILGIRLHEQETEIIFYLLANFSLS